MRAGLRVRGISTAFGFHAKGKHGIWATKWSKRACHVKEQVMEHLLDMEHLLGLQQPKLIFLDSVQRYVRLFHMRRFHELWTMTWDRLFLYGA